MTIVCIDTDRGALYGPTFDETLAYFFGRSQDVAWDCHCLAAGYIRGRKVDTRAIVVAHRGGWLTAARMFGVVLLAGMPDDVAVGDDLHFAVGATAGPTLPRWVYESAQQLSV